MENLSVFSFVKIIMNTLFNGANALYKVLNTKISLSGLANTIIKIIKFFGGTPPQSIIDLGKYDLSIMTIGGVLLASVVLIVIIKKIIPFL